MTKARPQLAPAHQAHIGSRSRRWRPGICSSATKRAGRFDASATGATAVVAWATLEPGVNIGAVLPVPWAPLPVDGPAGVAPAARPAFACATARVQLWANLR